MPIVLTLCILYAKMNTLIVKGVSHMANTSMNIRMDSDVKKKAEILFSEIGLNMTTAINIFLRQAIRENGMPFELTLNTPNKQTIEAIHDGEQIIKKGEARFNNADEMFADLGI